MIDRFARSTLAGIIAALFLTACDKDNSSASKPADPNNAKPASSAPATPANAAKSATPSPSADEEWSAKVNEHIKLANKLRGFVWVDNSVLRDLAAKREAKARAGDFKEIRTDDHIFGDAVEKVKKILSMKGDTPDADKAAAELQAAVEQHLPNWKKLIDYNTSKKYEDDKGEAGKKMLTEYIAATDALKKTVDNYSAKVDVLSRQLHDKTVEKFKANGQLLEMHVMQGMGHAERILDLFGNAADFKNAAKIEQGNKLLVELEKEIDAAKAEYDKRKAANDSKDWNLNTLNTVVDTLKSFAGYYREARKNPQAFNNAINAYNSAVNSYNTFMH